jgi:hypothetical protein
VVPNFQKVATALNQAAFLFVLDDAAAGNPPNFYMAKGRAGGAIVGNTDRLGNISWNASDGVNYIAAACIRGVVDGGVPGVDQIRGAITFETSRDSRVPTEAMRITSANELQMGGANTVIDGNRHFRLRSYTLATLPDPAAAAGQMIFCSDLGGGGGQLNFGWDELAAGVARRPADHRAELGADADDFGECRGDPPYRGADRQPDHHPVHDKRLRRRAFPRHSDGRRRIAAQRRRAQGPRPKQLVRGHLRWRGLVSGCLRHALILAGSLRRRSALLLLSPDLFLTERCPMQATYDAVLPKVLAHEGGYVNHPADPGGPTNKGITQAAYDRFRLGRRLPSRPVRSIDAGEVAAIYRGGY